MTASLRRTVIVVVAALGVAVMLVWATTTGPVGVIGTVDRTAEQAAPDRTEKQRPAEQDGQGEDSRVERRQGNDLVGWLQSAVGFLLLLMALWVLGLAVRAALLRIARELPEKQLVLDLDPLPDPQTGREAVQRQVGSLRSTLGTGEVRNAIVACWVLLEETAAEAGVRRRPAETATEFVVRFLHALDVDPRPVAALAGLYHEARFSTHDLPDDARERARAALHGIEHDVGAGHGSPVGQEPWGGSP